MLVASMTLDEIKHSIDKEMPSVINKLAGIGKPYLKHLRKYKIKNFERYHEYISLTKNRWLMHFSRRENEKDLTYVLSVYFQMATGYGAVIFNHKWYYYLTPHFLKRYNERLELKIINPIDRLKYYMSHMDEIVHIPIDEVKPGVIKYFATTNEGVVMGTYNKNLQMFKMNTFLNHKTLSGKQRNLANECAAQLDKYLPYAEMCD